MSSDPEKQGVTSPGAELGQVQRELAERESLLWSKVALKLVIGVPLTLLGPLVVAMVLTLFAWAHDWRFNYFTLWFLLACAAMLPMAYRMVRSHEERSFFAEWMIERVSSDVSAGETFSYEQMLARHNAEALNGVLQLLLKGPRDVYEAWQLIQERRRLGDTVRSRAADVVQQLSKYDKGISWLLLRKGEESVERLLEVLGYLRFTDWLEISQDGRKVWLLSEARKAVMGRQAPK